MIKNLPRNPEKYFEKTPDKFSGTSRLLDLSTYESRRGILLGSLEEVRSAIKTYVTQLRVSEETNQNSDKIIRQTLKDLEARLRHANEEAMQPINEHVSSLKKDVEALSNVSHATRKRIYGTLKETIELLAQSECLNKGNLSPVGFMDYPKESLLGGALGEIKIETTNHKYIVTVNRRDPNKNFNEGYFEQELAKALGKERLVYQAGVKTTFSEVDGAWYNIPFFKILELSGLRYAGRGLRQDIVKSSLKRIGKRISKELGEKLLNSTSDDSLILYLPHKGRRYVASFKIENLHSWLSPEAIEFDDDLDCEEKSAYRYAQIRGNNIVGPAWTIYRRKKWARVEKPILDIALSYAGGYPWSDVSVINEEEINRLVEARNKLAGNLGSKK